MLSRSGNVNIVQETGPGYKSSVAQGNLGQAKVSYRHSEQAPGVHSPERKSPSKPTPGILSGACATVASVAAKTKAFFTGTSAPVRKPNPLWILEMATEYVTPDGSQVEDNFRRDFSSKQEAEAYAYQWQEEAVREGNKIPYTIKIYAEERQQYEY